MSGARAPTGVTAPAAARVEDVIAGWRAPALIVLVVIGVAALYWPSTQSLLHEWLDTPDSVYGHGALVAIVMLTLILRSVHAARLTPEPEAKALWWLLLAAASLAWLVALRTGIQVAHQLMLPALMWLAIRALFGRRVAALCLVPVALLYCAIPVWHAAIPLLQDMTVVVVRTLLRLVGIAAYAQDEFIYIRGAVFQVEEGCAGLRYFTVGIAIAAVVGAMRGDGWRTYAKLMSFAIALTIAANWLRVFIVIVAGHLTDMQHYFVRVEHVSLGWAVFALGMLVFLLVVRATRGFCIGHVGPEAAAGGPIALIENGDIISIDASDKVRSIMLEVDEKQMTARRAKWKPRSHDYQSGALWKYAQGVGPAEKGAVTHPGAKKETHMYADL